MYRMQLTVSSVLRGAQCVFIYKTEQGERFAATSSPPTSGRPDDDIFVLTSSRSTSHGLGWKNVTLPITQNGIFQAILSHSIVGGL